jgi:TetR/AcrR family transcriptional regulator, transcriptional repressor of bet genes
VTARRRGPASTAQGRASRARVLRASLSLITERGIDGVRLEEIARRASMSSGQVMHYFSSKEHILLETLAWRQRADARRRRVVLQAVSGAWEQLARYVDLYLPPSPADPVWILWAGTRTRAPHDPRVSEFLDDLVRPWHEDIARILEHGIQDQVFVLQRPADEFMTCFTALLDGLTMLYVVQKPELPRQRLVELAMTTARIELTPAGR